MAHHRGGWAITVATDGTEQGSRASIEREGRPVEEIVPSQVRLASCSVHTFDDGSRRITATIWIVP